MLLIINYNMQKSNGPGKNGPKSKPPAQTVTMAEPVTGLGKFHEAGASLTLADQFIGKRLSARYHITEKIGEGGMGTIYLAEDERLDKKVALKILAASFAGKSSMGERFIQEAKVVTRIEHENVVDVTDLNVTEEGVPYFVMEYLKGNDLSDVMSSEGPLSWERSKNILMQICRGLEAAHKKGIVHRDMKPGNVFMAERDEEADFVKILDFGIAKLLKEAGGDKKQMTLAGSLMGTPDYMSPEQIHGLEVDHKSDVYAVGVIMYEMLCGCVPFEGDSVMEIFEKHVKEVPIPPSEKRPDLGIPRDVEAVIMKALEKNPRRRFSTIKQMEMAILDCEGVQTIKPAASTESSVLQAGYAMMKKKEEERRTKRTRNFIMAAAIIAAAGAATVAAHIGQIDILEKIEWKE